MSDFAALAAPLTSAEPCGSNVEYDPDFLQLEQEAQGKPEIEYGSNLTQATPPNWQLVMSLALPLMQRSRDLRLAVYLTRAQLNLHSVAGFAAGLALIEALLVTRWQDVHPQLDPDDDNDPLLRINTLASLCESTGILRELREAPLVSARSLGHFSLRDIDIATGELVGSLEQEKTTLAVIDAAFQEVGQEMLAATRAALTDALERSIRIEQLLTEKVGFAQAIDLSALSSMLRRAAEFVGQRVVDSTLGQPPLAAVTSPAAVLSQSQGEISSRDDVKHMLDRLCTYYAINEPSSPVPLLLQRTRKLVDKNFIELLQDLAPDGLGQLAQVSGIREES